MSDSFVEIGIFNAWTYQPKNCPESGSGASCFRTIHVAESFHQQAAALYYRCLLQAFQETKLHLRWLRMDCQQWTAKMAWGGRGNRVSDKRVELASKVASGEGKIELGSKSDVKR